MKRFLIGFLILSAAVFCIPSVMVPIASLVSGRTAAPAYADSAAADDTAAYGVDAPYTVTLYRVGNGETLTLDFEDYIAGIVAEEMPPTNSIEALKAQAVAARSYILSKLSSYSENAPAAHHGALLCDDFSHCHTWRSLEESKDTWDARFREDYAAKIKRAADETRGEYLSYENKAAKTCFHAVSGGKTENAEDVWGVSLPYLTTVNSAEDTRADGYHSRVFYPKEAFETVLRGLRPSIQTAENLEDISPKFTYHDSGSVAALTMLGETFTGLEIREAFHLRSTHFSLKFADGKAVFDVNGYGHGVGMSQFGAAAMADQGKDYRAILAHYYKGTTLSQLYHNA